MSHDIASLNVARKVSKQSPKFKKRIRRGTALAAAVAGLGLFGSTSRMMAAQTFNGTSGTWDAGTSTNWDSAQVWTNANDAVFSGNGTNFVLTVDNTGAGGPVTVGDMTFSAAGYSIGGSTLTLVSGSANSGASTITTSADATISAVLGGSVGLTKLGNSQLTLSGADNYSGTTTVSAGTLDIASGGSLASTTIIVGSSGTFTVEVAGSISAATNLTDSGIVNFNNPTRTINSLNGSGALNLNGTNLTISNGGTFSGAIHNGASPGSLSVSGGNLTLTNTNTYTGSTTISGGTLTLNGSLASASTVGIGTSGTLAGTGTVNGNATLTGSGIINFSGAGNIVGTLGVTGGNWNGAGGVSGLVTSSSGTFTIGSGANLTAGSGLSVTGGSLAAGSATSTITGSVNYTSATSSNFAGVIAGSGKTLTLSNASATLTLTNTNTYTGTTTITAGTLQLGDGTTNNGTVGGTITDNAALVFANPLSLNFGFAISGSGTVTKSGAGTLILGATNAYAGATTVSGGTLKMTNILSLGTNAQGTTVAGGATLEVTTGGTVATETLNLTGTGSGGVGALLVDDTVTWSGGITVASGGATINVADNATITASGAGTMTGNMVKSGLGTLLLGAGNTGTGTLSVSAGTVSVNASGNWNAGAISVVSGATFQNTGGGTNSISDTSTITINSGGVLDTQQTGAETTGPITLNGSGIRGNGAWVNNSANTGGTITVASPGITLGSASTIGGNNSGTIATATAFNASGFTLTKAGETVFKSTVAAGLPFGDGSIVLNGGSLAWVPTGSTTISLGGANAAAGSTFTYGGGGIIALTKGTNTAITYTVGNASPSGNVLVRNGTGTLSIAPTALANLGASEKFVVNGLTSAANQAVGAAGTGIYDPSVVAVIGGATTSVASFVKYSTTATNGFVDAASGTSSYTTHSGASFTTVNNEIADVTTTNTITDGGAGGMPLHCGWAL